MHVRPAQERFASGTPGRPLALDGGADAVDGVVTTPNVMPKTGNDGEIEYIDMEAHASPREVEGGRRASSLQASRARPVSAALVHTTLAWPCQA